MRSRLIWLTTVATTLTIGLGGCSGERYEIYNKAMRSTVSDLRSGDIDGAASTLETARAYADDSEQKHRTTELGLLIDGAQAYCRGDRAQAGTTWSGSSAPEFRRAITSNQDSLGVTLTTAKKN